MDKASEEKRKVIEKTKISYRPLTYPSEADATHICNQATIHDYCKHMSQNSIAVHIEAFLANAKVAKADICGRGISCWGLYILHRIRAYQGLSQTHRGPHPEGSPQGHCDQANACI